MPHLLHFSFNAHSETLNCSVFLLFFSLHGPYIKCYLFIKLLQFAHVEAWGGGGWLCYGCNTTVIYVMKRFIYFLITTNNQEVQRSFCLRQNPCIRSFCSVLSMRKLWCSPHKQKHEVSIMIYMSNILRFKTHHLILNGCEENSFTCAL